MVFSYYNLYFLDDLVKARCDCEKAQFTSDYSENDQKRKIKKKTYSSSSDEASDDSNTGLPKVPEGNQ